MALVESGTKFPSFQESKDYFADGIGSAPEFNLVSAPALGGDAGGPAPGLDVPSAPGVGAPPPPPPPTGPTAGEAIGAQEVPGVTPGIDAPYDVPYQTTGTLTERLYDPLATGAEVGGEQLEEFADMFRTAAGPSRTYAGIGAEETLRKGITGEGPLGAGRELVEAQYTGPAGLDPQGTAYLTDLARQLEARQRMLQTGGGLTTAIGQSVPGLTPGESRFQAEHMFAQPGFRAGIPAETAEVGEFTGALDAETQAALAYAAQRAGEERAIAEQAQEFLTGERAGITGDIEAQLAETKAREAETQALYDQALAGETPQEIVAALQQLQGMGAIDFTGTGTDVGQFLSPITLGGQEAERREAEIMGQYPDLAQYPTLIRGPSPSGRGTLNYFVEDEAGNLVDYRTAYPDKALRKKLRARQEALEAEFDPLEAALGRPGAEAAAYRPLYFGEDFVSPEITDFLGFNPSIRPTLENVSTEEQRTQFNNINEMLGQLDRISEAETPFQAATIAASIDDYLTAEEEAFEAQKGELSETALNWKRYVKNLRKRYKKAKEKESWGMVLDIVQAGVGTGAISGAPAGYHGAGVYV